MQLHFPSSPGSSSARHFPRGCAALFGLPFFIPGMLLAAWITWMNWQTLRQSVWEATEVIVLQVPEKPEDLADESKGLHYRYDAGGESYTVRNVAPHLPLMTGDDEKRALVEKANAALRGEAPLLCWVNSQQPAEHTLLPASPTMIPYFLGIFTFSHGLLGLLILTGQWGAKQRDSTERGVPRSGQTTSRLRDRRWIAALTMFLLVNAFTIPSALRLMMPLDQTRGTTGGMHEIPLWLAVVVLALSLVPLRFVFRHFKAVRLNRHLLLTHPTSSFAYTQPFRLSLGHLEPGQELPYEVVSATEWRAECKLKEGSADSARGQPTRYKLVHGIDLQPVAQGGGSLRLAGEKLLPDNALSTELLLEISGRTRRGVPLGPFPISLLPEREASSEHGTTAETSPAPTDNDFLLTAENIRHRKNADGSHTWEFPGSRFATAGRILFLLGVLAAMIDAVLLGLVLLGSRQTTIIFFAFFSLATALLFALHHVLSADRSVEITSAGLVVRTRSKLAKRERFFARDSLVGLQSVTKANLNGQPLFHVELISIDQVGKEVRTMVSGLIANRHVAEHVAAKMTAALGRRLRAPGH